MGRMTSIHMKWWGLTWFNHLEKYESQYGKLMKIIQMFETTNQKIHHGPTRCPAAQNPWIVNR